MEKIYCILGIILLISSFLSTTLSNSIIFLLFAIVFLYISRQYIYKHFKFNSYNNIVNQIKEDKKSQKFYLKKENKSFITILQEKVNNIQIKKDTLISQIKQAEETIKNLQKDYKSITINLKELEKQKQNFLTSINKLEPECKSLAIEVEDLKQQKGILTEELNILKLQKNNLPSLENNIFSLEAIDSLNNGEDFEKYISVLLQKLNYTNISLTRTTGDFGIDILATKDEIIYAFQCKLYSNPVGNKAIQEIVTGKTHYKYNVGIVVTNNYFTPQAIQQAQENSIILWNRDTLNLKIAEINKLTIKNNFNK